MKRSMSFELMGTAMAAVLALTGVACGSDPAPAAVDGGSLPPPSPETKVAGFKGYEAVNQTLVGRLVSGPEGFQLTAYLGGPGSPLASLLGAWRGTGIRNEFANAHPNAMNFLIWRAAFIGLGQDLARLCPGSTAAPLVPGLRLHPSAATALAGVCGWPGLPGQGTPDATLLPLWGALVGFDAPVEQYEAWRKHFTQPAYAALPGQEVIPLLVAGALLNPYFLLEN